MPDQQEIYARELDALITSQYSLVGDTAATIQGRVQSVLDEFTARLSRIPPDGFTAATVRQQIAGLRRSFEGLSDDLSREFRFLVDESARNGVAKIVDPMDAVGLNVPPVNISQNLVNVATRFSAGLIRNITREMLTKIDSLLTRAALRAISPGEAIRLIGGTLPNSGPFASIVSRATAIYRTESLRMYSLVADQQLMSTAAIVPGMRKMWVHTGLGITNPRSTHVAYSGTIVGVRETFRVAGAPGLSPERLRFPRDPRASAANVVGCACSSNEIFPSQKQATDLGLDRATSQVLIPAAF